MMTAEKLIKIMCDAIDEARANINGNPEDEIVDNFERKRERESAQAEIIGAITAYREEALHFNDLLALCQSYDRKVTPRGLLQLVGYNGPRGI